MGLNERNAQASNASLYNTLLYIDPEGDLMGKHQKLVPTAPERMVWAQGDGSTLEAYDTDLGKTQRADLLGELHAACSLFAVSGARKSTWLRPGTAASRGCLPSGTSPRKDGCTW